MYEMPLITVFGVLGLGCGENFLSCFVIGALSRDPNEHAIFSALKIHVLKNTLSNHVGDDLCQVPLLNGKSNTGTYANR